MNPEKIIFIRGPISFLPNYLTKRKKPSWWQVGDLNSSNRLLCLTAISRSMPIGGDVLVWVDFPPIVQGLFTANHRLLMVCSTSIPWPIE